MDILLIEDEVLLGLLLAEALADVGHRVLGPASCRAEALDLLAETTPQLALVDIELRDGESGIELAGELERHGIACMFATGQPEKAREHRELALGLIAKPCSPTTMIEIVRYFEATLAGDRPVRVPRGLELFVPDAVPETARRVDTSAPAIVPFASPDRPAAVGSAPAISAGMPPQADQRLGDAGVLEAVTG
jgi:two-component system, response regulator PdtaR